MKKMSVETFGEARLLILDTIMAVRAGELSVERGMTIAANMKTLNDNIQVEINAAKVSMIARERGHDFGLVCRMGQKLIGPETAV